MPIQGRVPGASTPRQEEIPGEMELRRPSLGGGRPRYSHNRHAGNAGDVWKHFILAEAADYLLKLRPSMAYIESHGGYPGYELSEDDIPRNGLSDHGLNEPAEWTGGIGVCWKRLTDLRAFPYFDVLAGMNADILRRYPGSISIVVDIAVGLGREISCEIWDTDPGAVKAWQGRPYVRAHLGDGFAGARRSMKELEPGLMLIDPPYVDEEDRPLAEALLDDSFASGWSVLWWQMTGGETFPRSDLLNLPLHFANLGMNCGRWHGCLMALASDDAGLKRRLRERARELKEVIKIRA